MKLHRLTVKNFMPYKGENTIDFPTDETRNVMLVFGENMRGKTSLLNALRWAFYGKAVGRHSRPIQLHEIVNKDAGAQQDWRVEAFVSFEANGQLYELRRTAELRPLVSTPTRPEDFLVMRLSLQEWASVTRRSL
jgi:DNA sulfur modification protein DndD